MGALNYLFKKHCSPDHKLIDAIGNIFGFTPKNIAPYKLACRHRSVAQTCDNGYRISNERLEFLGDAILGSIVAEYLFKKFPYKDEGFLTDIRSRIVNRTNLNYLSRRLGLYQLIKTHNEKQSATSIPGDAFEAFIGAIYIDKGYEFTKQVIINKIINYHIDIDELISTEVNFKSKLIEWGQKNKQEIKFNLVKEEEVNNKYKIYEIDVLVDNEKLGAGVDYSIKKAEQIASKLAMEKLSNKGL